MHWSLEVFPLCTEGCTAWTGVKKKQKTRGMLKVADICSPTFKLDSFKTLCYYSNTVLVQRETSWKVSQQSGDNTPSLEVIITCSKCTAYLTNGKLLPIASIVLSFLWYYHLFLNIPAHLLHKLAGGKTDFFPVHRALTLDILISLIYLAVLQSIITSDS